MFSSNNSDGWKVTVPLEGYCSTILMGVGDYCNTVTAGDYYTFLITCGQIKKFQNLAKHFSYYKNLKTINKYIWQTFEYNLRK